MYAMPERIQASFNGQYQRSRTAVQVLHCESARYGYPDRITSSHCGITFVQVPDSRFRTEHLLDTEDIPKLNALGSIPISQFHKLSNTK